MFRFRNLFLLLGSALVLAVLMATDPDEGLLTGFWALSIAKGIVAVAFAHLARKSLADYPEADMRTLFRLARGSATGAGLALIAQAIIILGLLFLFGGNARADVPERAKQYLPMLKAEQTRWWPDHPFPPMLGGMAEQESCVTLTHSRCWSPLAQLKTKREEGAGISMLTRAFHPDGRTRFDALAEVRERHPALRDLSWANVYQRPDLQLRALVLKSRDDYLTFGPVRSIVNRLVFQVAAYNRGVGGVQAERRLCQITDGCDPQLWWGHVELTCTASRQPIYSGRSACDINRVHVKSVLTRSQKYKEWLSQPQISDSKDFLSRESSFVPGINGGVLHSDFSGPILQAHGPAIESQHGQWHRGVSSLLLVGGPNAVAWAVVGIPIEPFYGQVSGSLPHVSQEVFKLLPALTDLDAFAEVTCRALPVCEPAPGDHASPYPIGRAFTHAMGQLRRPQKVGLEASAGFGFPLQKERGSNHFGGATLAATNPSSLVNLPLANHSQAAKNAADFHFVHAAGPDVKRADCMKRGGGCAEISALFLNGVIEVRAPRYRGWL